MNISTRNTIAQSGFSSISQSQTTQDATKSYDPFEGDKYLSLFKTLAVDTREETAKRPMPTENKYRKAKPANKFVKWLVRGIIRIIWAFGGKNDKADGIPRLYGKDIKELLPTLQAGDIILNGNNAGLSHLAMYAGDGQIIHSMATEKTMRGTWGAIWDAIKACFVGVPEDEKTGVLKESLAGFLNRFERDTYIVVRREDLTAAQREAGLARLNELVGKPYDYDFSAGDDEYYCTELTVEYLDAALGREHSTVFPTTHHNYGIFKTDGIEPVNVLQHPLLTPIAASKSADVNFAPYLGNATSY